MPPFAASVAAYAFPTVPAGRLLVVMTTGFGAGGGLGGGVGFDGGEVELPEVDELPGGGSEPLCAGAVELPPQPASASASAITARGTTLVVVILPGFIVLTPLRRRADAATNRGKHQPFLHRQRARALNEHPLDSAVVRAGHVLSHPVLAQNVPGDFNDDVVCVEIGVVVIALQALQA